MLNDEAAEAGEAASGEVRDDPMVPGLELTPKQKRQRETTNCSPPAIEQFPQPLMDKHYRQRGGLIIHILVAIYMFIGLAIVCDDYFVPALDRLSEGKYKINKFPHT